MNSNVRRAIARARQAKQLAQERRARAETLMAKTEALLRRYDELDRAVARKQAQMAGKFPARKRQSSQA